MATSAIAIRPDPARQSDRSDLNQLYALEIVTLAARIADRYQTSTYNEDTAGDAVGANLFD